MAPRDDIAHVMWGLAGLILGAAIALLLSQNWSPDWIGTTGTWIGAVATVLTLLWAVRSFRTDQDDREEARLAELPGELVDIELRGLFGAFCLDQQLDRGPGHPDIRLDIDIQGRQQETARQHIYVGILRLLGCGSPGFVGAMGTTQDFSQEQVPRKVRQALKYLGGQDVFHATTAVSVPVDVTALPRHLLQ